MMVTFVSQCEKKALNRTRRVLDAFADRIGSNTWQTVITQEGLLAVKKLLRKTATKNTAVACHWLRSRSRSELLWVVGRKDKFNTNGVVPVNSTQVNRIVDDTKRDWRYLPLIQALACISALLHDWGKANAYFQAKLRGQTESLGDPIRHEWVSCILLKAFILIEPVTWLQRLAKGEIDETKLANQSLAELSKERLFQNLDKTAQVLMWLIVSHHRLPCPKSWQEWANQGGETLEAVLNEVSVDWGYQNDETLIHKCLVFDHGFLSKSTAWLSDVKRWARKLAEHEASMKTLVAEGGIRVVLHHARLALMLGDHYYSSRNLEQSGYWKAKSDLAANTDKDGSLKQCLDQHLVGVYRHSRDICRQFPALETAMPVSNDTANLRKASPEPFDWQDKAVKRIRNWRKDNPKRQGFFIVNVASTGCGKTFANAKVMRALSESGDQLRYCLALGLRTLTLQTGDEYRKKIFHADNQEDLGVLIGSKAIAVLHNAKQQENKPESYGSESSEQLLQDDESLLADTDIDEHLLETVLTSTKQKQLLSVPVLACTLDHLMQATECTRGGKYILPSLRLLSSDLVIDEIDDFTGSDLIAIGRLIFLAGMLGRKVMISSATIPPAMAEGYADAYSRGWRLYAQTRDVSTSVVGVWIDEFDTQVSAISTQQVDKDRHAAYRAQHDSFIKKRLAKLEKQPVLRKAELILCDALLQQQQEGLDTESLQQKWFEIIAKASVGMHQRHHLIDDDTGIRVSFGCIRVANIQPCVALTRFLLNTENEDATAIKAMAYHSNQVVLLRSAQERHLDEVLTRKDPKQALTNPIIRQHLNKAKKEGVQDLAFIVVATPVEEVGRDHDFDWAIIEPSSFRSIVQMAGRVQRHRKQTPPTPNVGVLQYNWRALRDGAKPRGWYFRYPGFEDKQVKLDETHRALLPTYDLAKLLNFVVLSDRLDASARITGTANGFAFARLEHKVTEQWLATSGRTSAHQLVGYTKGCWNYTALSQKAHQFRAGAQGISLYRYVTDSADEIFTIKDQKGHVLCDDMGDPLVMNEGDAKASPRSSVLHYQIDVIALSEREQAHLWLSRNYSYLLEQFAESQNQSMQHTALLVGELVLPNYKGGENTQQFLYNENLGFYQVKGGNNAG